MAAAPVSGPEQPTRSTADVLSGRLRIRLAGQWYVLPVLTIGQNEEWVASLNAELAPLLADVDSVEDAVRLMEGLSDKLLDFVRSYDRAKVLPPPGAWEKDIYPHELLRAVMEVRLATDPTASYATAAFSEALVAERGQATAVPKALAHLRSERSSSSRRPTAGRSRKSAKN